MRPISIWLIFAAALAIVFGSLGWFTYRVIELERKEWRTVAEYVREGRETDLVQRALYRMELAIQPLLLSEAARPWYSYAAFHAGERAILPTQLHMPQRDLYTASELLGAGRGLVRLHFQIGPDEVATSPQAPDGALEQLAIEREIVSAEVIARAREQLVALGDLVRRHPLKRILIGIERAAEIAGDPPGLVADLPTLESSIAEYRARARQVQRNAESQTTQNAANAAPQRVAATAPIAVPGTMRAVWCGEELLLARHINVDGEPYVQGCWLDRAAVESQLLAGIENLLPDARLVRRSIDAPAGESEQRFALLGLPFELEPGAIPAPRDRATGGDSARASLFLALGSALVAAIAVGAILFVLLAAAERRAAFVSAVTHELRTPLTTLRMYAEMLADGRVKAERQPQYFDTLRREADRLAALVENVLAFSRIESRRASPRVETIALAHLVARTTERAAERASRAGMMLVIAVENGEASVTADPGGIEQIVFNLVDNACKYASEAADRSIELAARADAHGATITLRDHGPGIDAAAAKRLFEPFRRPDKAETSGKPGVGLGLALCRRLARAMGGELRFVAGDGGARFELQLRTVTSRSPDE